MFLKYDSLNQKCGYVQGMNFMAGFFSYHACAEISFCLFTKLMQKFEILENYKEGLQGLNRRYYEIDLLILKHLPKLSQFLQMHHVSMQEICLEIIMSMFGTLIPFDCLTYFYDKFIEYGWVFFNALIIEFL
jgi:hypothetical protein